MTAASKFWPIGAAALLAASPAAAQDQAQGHGSVEIVTPAGINISDESANRLMLSQSSITFVAPVGGGPGIAGFVETERTDATANGLILQGDNVYALSGTTLDHGVLSVSVASAAQVYGTTGDPAEALRRVVAQYN